MSKQEKLAALLHRVQDYARGVGLVGPLGTRVKNAYRDYESIPDDPPQPPEMPECVSRLVKHCWEDSATPNNMLRAIEDHYRQPLKLEVGKVYEDGHEGPVQIVWKSPSPNGYRWLGVVVTNGETRWFNDDGKPPCQTPEFKLIREVRQ